LGKAVISFRRLREALLRLVTRASWPGIVIAIAVLYCFGAVCMPLLEGPESVLANLSNYTWWFVVTATTVGYGDISPATAGGRAVAVVIMLLGVGLIAITVAKIAEEVVDIGKRRMRGLVKLNEERHLVILGYRPGETEALVEELLGDANELENTIVLCASAPEENPIPDRVAYVRGDLSSEDVLERACIAQASRVLVHGRDDNETLVVTLAVRSVNRRAHVVTRIDKPASHLHLKRIDPGIECVRSLTVPLMVHAIQDPGTTAVISGLLSHQVDDTVFRMLFPKTGKSWNFGALQHAFKQKLEATLFAFAGDEDSRDLDLNPKSQTIVPAGSYLFYIAAARLEPDRVPWNEL
jgi:voltage-gated potassium channel